MLTDLVNGLTEEQIEVVKAIYNGDNVCCLAVAGSGKTTTSLTAARAFLDRNPQSSVCLLTYNTMLKEETRSRVNTMPYRHSSRITVDSYHASASRFFICKSIASALQDAQQQTKPSRPIPQFGLIIVDEAQDINAEMYGFLKHFLSVMRDTNSCNSNGVTTNIPFIPPHRDRISSDENFSNPPSLSESNIEKKLPQMLILGDPFQRIYGQMRGATVEYMYRHDKYFVDTSIVKNRSFVNLKLSICFRISHEMAEWICEYLNPKNLKNRYKEWWERNGNGERVTSWWGETGIRASPKRERDPDSLTFVVAEYKKTTSVTNAVKEAMKNFDNSQMAVLSRQIHGLKDNHPTTIILKEIGEKDWYLDMTEKDINTIGKLLQNKYLVSSIHKFKGVERDAIIVLSVDAFWERMSVDDPLELYNLYYVACTRARKKLIVVQWGNEAYVTVNKGQSLCDLTSTARTQYLEVTKLLAYAGFDPVLSVQAPPPAAVDNVLWFQFPACLRVETIVPGRSNNTFEDVSDVIGIAMELRFSQQTTGVVPLPELTDGMGNPLTTKEAYKIYSKDFVDHYLSAKSDGEQNAMRWGWAKLCEASVLIRVVVDRSFHTYRQVKNFDKWVQPLLLDVIFAQLIGILYEALVCDSVPIGTRVAFPPWLESQQLQRETTDTTGSLNLATGVFPKFTISSCSKCAYVSLEEKMRQLVGKLPVNKNTFPSSSNFPTSETLCSSSASSFFATPRNNTTGEIRTQASVKLPFPNSWFSAGVGIHGIFDFIHFEYMYEKDDPSTKNESGCEDKNSDEEEEEIIPSSRIVRVATIIELKMTKAESSEHVMQLAIYGALFLLSHMGYSAGDELVTGPLPPKSHSKTASNDSENYGTQIDEGEEGIFSDLSDSSNTVILAKNPSSPIKALRLLLVYPQLGIARRVVLSVNPYEYIYRMARRKVNLPFDKDLYKKEVEIKRKNEEDIKARGDGILRADGALFERKNVSQQRLEYEERISEPTNETDSHVTDFETEKINNHTNASPKTQTQTNTNDQKLNTFKVAPHPTSLSHFNRDELEDIIRQQHSLIDDLLSQNEILRKKHRENRAAREKNRQTSNEQSIEGNKRKREESTPERDRMHPMNRDIVEKDEVNESFENEAIGDFDSIEKCSNPSDEGTRAGHPITLNSDDEIDDTANPETI